MNYLHNDYLFYCSVCHQIQNFQSGYDIYSHFNEKKDTHEQSLEWIETSFNEMIKMKEKNENIEKINFDKTSGVVVYVYDLGSFLFQNLEIIKNKPISVFQIPFTPSEIVGELTDDLDKIDFDVLYPSNYCKCSYPCWHGVYLHLEGDSLEKWYSYKEMRGDKIAKYIKMLPKTKREHFIQYKCGFK